MKILLGLLLIGLLALVTVAKPRKFFNGRDSVGSVRQLSKNESLARSNNAGEAAITQKLDHFDENNTATWQQRYFFNLDYRRADVNFLYISGESTAGLETIQDETNPIVMYAKNFAAGLYAIEHRFYGMSRPTEQFDDDSLKYLTSRQALADAAEFIKLVNAGYFVSQKWIVFGGSYAGNLALWMRELYPQLVIGAVGSSAPLLAQPDFTGYFQAIEDDIRKFDNKYTNTTGCAVQVKSAFDTVSEYMQNEEGRHLLDRYFHPDPKLTSFEDLSENVIASFYSGVIKPFMDSAQYGGIGITFPVDELCSTMTSGTATPIQLLSGLNMGLINPNYTQRVEDLSTKTWDDTAAANDRAFMWQSCNEFGYFKSTDRGSNLFGSVIPNNLNLNLCKDVFHIDPFTLKDNIRKTNAYFGGRDYYTGTNVVITYGTQDPWHMLSKYTAQHESVAISVIEGGVHTRDMFPICQSDICDDGVNRTQTLIVNNMERWLGGYDEVPAKVDIIDHVGQRPLTYTNDILAPIQPNDLQPTPALDTAESTRAKRSSKADKRRGRWLKRRNEDVKSKAWPPNLRSGTVHQPLDHFNSSNGAVFSQRFFINDTHTTEGGPNLLVIAGAVGHPDGWIFGRSQAVSQYAQELGATIFLLEHRYYGKSKVGTTDIQYLSAAQALYDVETFIKIANKEHNLRGDWITFGTGYAGALAAWSREWFPELIVGTVASSANMETKTDFYEYHLALERTIRNFSDSCGDRIQEGFKTLQQWSLSTEGRTNMSELFYLYPDWSNTTHVSALDLQKVYARFIHYFQTVVEGSLEEERLTLAEMCKLMEDTNNEPIEAIRSVQVWVEEGSPDFTTPVRFTDDIKYYRKVLRTIDDPDDDPFNLYDDTERAEVLWLWQQCNEFGLFQSTDYGSGLFGSGVPLNHFIITCELVFGATMDHVERGVARSNYLFGNKNNYKGTNAVFTSGMADPWQPCNIVEHGDLDQTVVPIVIQGGGHGADARASSSNDTQALKESRMTILTNIKKWIGKEITSTLAPKTTTHISTTATETTISSTMQPTSTGMTSTSTMTSSSSPSSTASNSTTLPTSSTVTVANTDIIDTTTKSSGIPLPFTIIMSSAFLIKLFLSL